jgi:hypothetical protein
MLLAGAATFGLGLQPASAADQPGAQRDERSKEQGADQQQAPTQPGWTGKQGTRESPGMGQGEKGQQQGAVAQGEPQCGAAQGEPYTLGALNKESAAPPAGFGAGLSPIAGGGVGAPLPQYWLADAALFTGNAANAANVLSLEHGLAVPAPAVLGDQAQFLIAATNRALTSLNALQQNAESSNAAAVADIRNAVGQLTAAQGAANQVADAAASGVVGPGFEATTRAALQHLNAAQKSMASIGRAYNAPALASIASCPTRAFGAGLGPTHKAPAPKIAPPEQAAPKEQVAPPQP